MNKIISTQDRVIMAVVGPSGCGKTELIFEMLIANTFYPKFNNIIFLYREMQQIYIKMEKTLAVNFKTYANLEFLNSLANCLLIIDDSCEEICNDKEFVKLATAGRHKNINVIYIKHHLYQQSKWSRTIDLNTTRIILIKSARDVHQVQFVGKQLNLVKFLKHYYQLATKEPIAETTPLNNEREKIFYTEANGASAAKTVKEYLRSCDSDSILVLCEYLHNVLLGHVRVKVRDLENYRHICEGVNSKKYSMDKRRALLLTKTGFELIQLIIKPCFNHLS